MTGRARAAIEASDTVVGYTTYIRLITPMLAGKKVISTGMKAEVDRSRDALTLAADGGQVVFISSGDPGIYGMAGLAIELAGEMYPGGMPFSF